MNAAAPEPGPADTPALAPMADYTKHVPPSSDPDEIRAWAEFFAAAGEEATR